MYVPTSPGTKIVPFLQICQLMTFRDIIDIDYERHTKHVNTMRDKIRMF